MDELVILVVGLGYVGLPLSIEFGKKYRTYGFDLSREKIAAYRRCLDPSRQLDESDFKSSPHISFTDDDKDISLADVIIIAVPTPVDEAHTPDFSHLINASIVVGKHIKEGAIIVYESTVYPGATEEICIPLLERHSGGIWKEYFHVGYSPERVNPGDKERTITENIKVVAGDDEKTLKFLSKLYGSVITAGVHEVSSIKVAEASKVIENTQRDLNIALMNELSIIFNRIGIDTKEVLDAAATKWNFLPFKPGLVGGHCIGVDPYYLTYKSRMLGYNPEIILAGRRINDGMPTFVVNQTIKKMIRCGFAVRGAKVIILGATFKEDCPDLRNSKVIDIYNELQEFECNTFVHDPVADQAEAYQQHQVTLQAWDDLPENADVVIAAVSHREYLNMPLTSILSLLKPNGIFIDIKSRYSPDIISEMGFHTWRL